MTITSSNQKDITVLFPGGFKPVHAAHIELIKRYASHPNVKEVRILIGPGIRNGINQDLSLNIAKELLSSFNKVIIEAVKYPSPILTAYKFMETANPGTYAMAGVKKGKDDEDYKRVLKFVQNLNQGGRYYEALPQGVNVVELSVDTQPVTYIGRTDDKEGSSISASILRQDILNNDYENFKTNYPDYDIEIIECIWKMLKPIVTVSESITPKVNKHMTHAEDLVLLGGSDGLKWVINMFKILNDKLQGNSTKEEISLSVKFDGAPSVFVWSKFPGLDKPGIAIKALFAKDKKVMFNNVDIECYYGQQKDLAFKLKFLLKYVPKLNIPVGEIWQGDFLFDKNSLVDEGKQYSFHPNTIVYKVDKDSDIGKKIQKSDIGLVWHTRYIGESLENISANYNINISELTENSKVFMIDPYIPPVNVTLSKEESNRFEILINEIESLSGNLYKDTEYNKIQGDKEIVLLFTTFQNSLVKQNLRISDNKKFLDQFINFVKSRFEKEINTKKTIKGQDTATKKMESCLKRILKVGDTLLLIIDLIIKIETLKNTFIKRLNTTGKFQNYLKTIEGKYVSTGEEGFAISDIKGNVVKLVDRYEFSLANFSPFILKGWVKKIT